MLRPYKDLQGEVTVNKLAGPLVNSNAGKGSAGVPAAEKKAPRENSRRFKLRR